MSNRLDKLAELFDKSVLDLIKRVESGDATASDYKNIIQLLKDNDITVEVKEGENILKLAEVLPFSAAAE
jgi:hypothetical protein